MSTTTVKDEALCVNRCRDAKRVAFCAHERNRVTSLTSYIMPSETPRGKPRELDDVAFDFAEETT